MANKIGRGDIHPHWYSLIQIKTIRCPFPHCLMDSRRWGKCWQQQGLLEPCQSTHTCPLIQPSNARHLSSKIIRLSGERLMFKHPSVITKWLNLVHQYNPMQYFGTLKTWYDNEYAPCFRVPNSIFGVILFRKTIHIHVYGVCVSKPCIGKSLRDTVWRQCCPTWGFRLIIPDQN